MLKSSCNLTESNISLDKLEAYFKAVNSPESRFFTPDEDVLYFFKTYINNEFSIMFEELNVPLTLDELLKAIKELKTNKAGGPDMLKMNFLYMVKMLFRHIY